MRRFLFGLWLVYMTPPPFVEAQTVLHFDVPIALDSLELTHKSAIHIDASQGVFDDHEAWLAEYKRLHAALAKHLKAGGLALHEKQKFYLRIYFQTEGRIGHLSYQHLEGPMTEKQAQLFEQLMTSFAGQFQLEKRADVPFKQCGSVLIQPNVELPKSP
ncbi:MAG: hypothetical protein Q8J69_02010 [Sphingobacteriaceae bacterium]|nr:hypothetical protein [Sphingobacteriaceae bacterium]